MKWAADLHLHSKYSRACSPDLTLENLSQWASWKGINLLATGDWTHPIWFGELRAKLYEDGTGFLRLKEPSENNIPFVLSCEISCIYSQDGKTRRIHLIVIVPSLATADKIRQALIKKGANLSSDGRPIIGLSAKALADLILTIDKSALVIPAHAWTPWFSLYGSMSGFDSIEECFGELSAYIYGVETGLSSDPAMNWRIDDLNKRSILSFSDAHSLPKLGRELTVFESPEISYEGVRRAVMGQSLQSTIDKPRVAYTIEFYPEEGKYHFTGHRNCQVVYSPKDTEAKGTICPKCRRSLTVGVMHRVDELARRIQNLEPVTKNDDHGVRWVYHQNSRPPFANLVPLQEILSEAQGAGVGSKKVQDEYQRLVVKFGDELKILLEIAKEELLKVTDSKIVEGILNVRAGKLRIEPGYDGVYGVVKIWQEDQTSKDDIIPQMNLFGGSNI